MNALPGQLELATVIDHKPSTAKQYFDNVMELDKHLGEFINPPGNTHKPAGVRLAKMLAQYDDSPSSQLWADIQRLAREILK